MKAFIRHLMPTKATDSPLSKTSRLLRGFESSLAARPCGRGVYKASLVDCERYALRCYRYIELNPVRAGMVSDPADYRWSSHRRNAGAERMRW
jgi:putative transposase